MMKAKKCVDVIRYCSKPLVSLIFESNNYLLTLFKDLLTEALMTIYRDLTESPSPIVTK